MKIVCRKLNKFTNKSLKFQGNNDLIQTTIKIQNCLQEDKFQNKLRNDLMSISVTKELYITNECLFCILKWRTV